MKLRIMAPDLPEDRILAGLLVLLALCILFTLILAVAAPSWFTTGPAIPPRPEETVHLKILAVNDFHGQLPPGETLNKRPVGSEPVMDAYLAQALSTAGTRDVIITLAGDTVGASPPESGLLLDEPTMLYYNSYANPSCTIGSKPPDPSCNMIATLGNHEFDKGVPELMRKIDGGNGTTNITHLVNPYPGSRSAFICANVVWRENGTTILPPYTLRNVGGVPVAFIGIDTVTTPRIQMAANVADVDFLDEAGTINRYVREIQGQGVHAFVILLHEGGSQTSYDGPTRTNGTVTGRVADVIPLLDADVDVVLSGHTHAFTNSYLENAGGNRVLLVQAYSYSIGYADLDLYLDPASRDIVRKTARIVPTYADQPPGNNPDLASRAFLLADEMIVGPQVEQVIGVAAEEITWDEDPPGESALGDLVTDGQRKAVATDVGFLSTGSLRAEIAEGYITWGDLYAVQPFGDNIYAMTLTGDQIRQALEQQWEEPLPPHDLAVSGLEYTYDPSRPAGSKLVKVAVNGIPLDDKGTYTASMVDYLAGGGDGYTVFQEGKNVTVGPVDVDALVAYVLSLPQPVNATIDGRVQVTG